MSENSNSYVYMYRFYVVLVFGKMGYFVVVERYDKKLLVFYSVIGMWEICVECRFVKVMVMVWVGS